MLRPAITDLQVTIKQQVAEADLVTTHKLITGIHSGTFMGIQATGKNVTIEVMDILKITNGKITDHWGINTLPAVLAELTKG